MSQNLYDPSVFQDFKFEYPPVAVNFLNTLPENAPMIDQPATLCEMLKSAFSGQKVCAAKENHACEAATYILGQSKIKKPFLDGAFGAGLGVFKDKQAAARIYQYIPHMHSDTFKYVSLLPFAQTDREPDVLIILANPTQAEIILRARSYSTGEMWQSRYSSVLGCSWLFAYPFLTGEINFISTGLGFGMRRRKLFPEGFNFISIPFNKLPLLSRTLREMPWVPRPYQPDGTEFVKELIASLGLGKT
jgi:uncharacterized protein (DUF169 family)